NTDGGNDTLTVGSEFALPTAGGAFTWNAGTGTDQINATGDVNFTLTNASLTSSGGGSIQLGSTVERANLTGGASSNQIDATTFSLGSVTLTGLGGNDTLFGGTQADSLIGGDGNDTLDGNQGSDQVFGGADSDTLIWDPGDGSDLFEGGTGQDIMLFN